MLRELAKQSSEHLQIKVRVTPNARKVEVSRLGDSEFEVKVDARASEGKANKRLIEILSEYFKVSKSRVRILKGQKSREKIIELIPDKVRV
ncbi:MAG: DUF167 domain-containing protein [Nitrososphaerota archaeon]|nr:DUF167 domain-containing protein [Nitrososphaerota archaeon]